ncbi:hypothetical protein [Rhodoflexus sp.]
MKLGITYYGINFAQETLILLPDFIKDAQAITDIINQLNDAAER